MCIGCVPSKLWSPSLSYISNACHSFFRGGRAATTYVVCANGISGKNLMLGAEAQPNIRIPALQFRDAGTRYSDGLRVRHCSTKRQQQCSEQKWPHVRLLSDPATNMMCLMRIQLCLVFF